MKKKEVIYLGADHAGFKLKQKIEDFLEKNKIPYEDLGAYNEKKTDYPDYAKRVVKKILKNKNSKGILICGTGTGMIIAANRFKGIRASIAYDSYSAKMSRFDNDANILCLRGRKFPMRKNLKLTRIWLEEDFSNLKRHKRRIKKLDKF